MCRVQLKQSTRNPAWLSNPRSRVDGLTALSGGGDGAHDAPEAAAAEEAAEAAAAGKVAEAAADVDEIVAAVAVADADGYVGWTLRVIISSFRVSWQTAKCDVPMRRQSLKWNISATEGKVWMSMCLGCHNYYLKKIKNTRVLSNNRSHSNHVVSASKCANINLLCGLPSTT